MVVAKLDTGSNFGEMSLIKGELRNASIRTVEFCEVYRLSKESFDGMRKKYPDFDEQVRITVEERDKKNREKNQKNN